MPKYVCVAKCPELDCDNSKHCTINSQKAYEEDYLYSGTDYCPCGNNPKFEKIENEAKVMVARFKIKGTCVDDLFHILESNGYQVQLSTTEVRDTYICDVLVGDLKSESEGK